MEGGGKASKALWHYRWNIESRAELRWKYRRKSSEEEEEGKSLEGLEGWWLGQGEGGYGRKSRPGWNGIWIIESSRSRGRTLNKITWGKRWNKVKGRGKKGEMGGPGEIQFSHCRCEPSFRIEEFLLNWYYVWIVFLFFNVCFVQIKLLIDFGLGRNLEMIFSTSCYLYELIFKFYDE